MSACQDSLLMNVITIDNSKKHNKKAAYELQILCVFEKRRKGVASQLSSSFFPIYCQLHILMLWNLMFVKKVLVNGHVTQAFKQMSQTTTLNFDAKVFFFFKKTEFCLNLQV